MFDIAFSELVVIAIVALLVIGPERLPKVARMLGTLMGRMQRYMAQIKEEVNREARFAELQKLQEEIKATASATHADLKAKTEEVVQDLEMHPADKEGAAETTQSTQRPKTKE